MGKSGGENARAIRSSSECSGEGGPQMCSSRLGPPERREEPQTFHVVEVQVRQEDVQGAVPLELARRAV